MGQRPARGPIRTRLRVACLAVALAPAAALAGEAARSAGRAEVAVGRVTAAARGGAVRPLAAGGAVAEGDAIETGAGSAAVVAFADGSLLTLGAGTRAAVERFAYDPVARRGVLSVRVAAGAFEFASGRMNKDGYDLRAPFVALALRGTRVGTDVVNEAIFVIEGEANARFLTGETLQVRAGGCTLRAAPGRDLLSGLACADPFAAYRLSFRALLAAADALNPDLLDRLGIRLPSPDQRNASPS
jgi:hypothetical protein